MRPRFQPILLLLYYALEGNVISFNRLQYHDIVSFNLTYHYVLRVYNLINISFHSFKYFRYDRSVVEDEYAC